MMTKKTPEELALEAYLAGLTEKKARISDNRLIATNNRSEEWHSKTAERNRKNATNDEIRKKIGDAHRGKKVSQETSQKRIKTLKENGNNHAWNKGIPWSEEVKEKLSKANTGKKIKEETKIKLQTSSALCKPFVTPLGIFWTKSKAAEYYLENKLTANTTKGSTNVWLSRQLVKFPKEFYYISKEEYIMLTGKDPLNE